MSFIAVFIAWLISFLTGNPRAIQVDGNVIMPLFYIDLNGKIASTWNYLSKSKAEQQHCRNEIKRVAVDGEQPAITFLLSHAGEDGGIWSNFPVINQPNLDTAVDAIKELVNDNIAVFPCLYTDDALPRWWEIWKHVDVWKVIHENIGRYVSGYILSIETNEQVISLAQLQDCIERMKSAMPGAQYYGTHLEYNAKSGNSNYRWAGGNTTPSNANLILVELWQPQSGDARGVQGVKILYSDIVAHEPNMKLCIHEYTFNPPGDICRQQREYLRNRNPWGVG